MKPSFFLENETLRVGNSRTGCLSSTNASLNRKGSDHGFFLLSITSCLVSMKHLDIDDLKILRARQKRVRSTTTTTSTTHVVVEQIRSTKIGETSHVRVGVGFNQEIKLTKRRSTHVVAINRLALVPHVYLHRTICAVAKAKYKRVRVGLQIARVEFYPRVHWFPLRLSVTTEYRPVRCFHDRQRAALFRVASCVKLARIEPVHARSIQQRPFLVRRELTELE